MTTREAPLTMALDDRKIDELVGLIKDSFRVRLNQDPVYVEVGDNLRRIESRQHQVIFGRRGSGKSCLFVHFYKSKGRELTTIYVLADEFKRLSYPDVLIRLIVEVLEQVPVRGRWWRTILRRPASTMKHAQKLRKLLDIADEADIVQADQSSQIRDARGTLSGGGPTSAGVSTSSLTSQERQSSFRERKIDTLERHLRDYKDSLRNASDTWTGEYAVVLVDDFYLLPRERQPDIADYLHRLLRDTDVFLKIATIRHRTSLIRNTPQTIGVELSQDVEELSLDRTLENLEETRDFLWQMLSSLATKVGIGDVATYFNPDAFEALTLVSGGVPRDALTIFVNAVEIARASGHTRWLTPTTVYKGAGRLAYQTKLQNLKEDAGVDADGIERVFVDLLQFCLKETRKTAFLVSQDEAQRFPREHEFIQQLMDFKLIHVVEPDTSAASGRPGRYEAYTLDFSLFMDPRRRNIEIVEFWKLDDQRRRLGIREAPVYSLLRVRDVFDDLDASTDPTDVLRETEDLDEAEPSLTSEENPPQQNKLEFE